MTSYALLFLLSDYIVMKLSFVDFISSFVRRNGNIAEHLVACCNSGSIIGESVFMYPFPQKFLTLASLDLI